MPDSWEFALEHIRGDYVADLGHNGVISSDLLKELHEILVGTSHISVTWRGGGYYHPDWPEKEGRCSLFLAHNPTTGEVLEISSSSLLEEMCALESLEHIGMRYPVLHHSCCSREFLHQRKRRMGRSFFPTCPDLSSAVAILTALITFYPLTSTWTPTGWPARATAR